MKLTSILRATTLLTAMAVPALSLTCLAQQEVAPRWDDPWAVTTPTKPAAETATAAKPMPETTKKHKVAAETRRVRKADAPATAHVEKVDTKDTRPAGSL